jgi:hypothetical protein
VCRERQRFGLEAELRQLLASLPDADSFESPVGIGRIIDECLVSFFEELLKPLARDVKQRP